MGYVLMLYKKIQEQERYHKTVLSPLYARRIDTQRQKALDAKRAEE